MYVQWCVKGVSGNVLTKKEDAYDLVTSGKGIPSNWLRRRGSISPGNVAKVLNAYNLDRHLHDYVNFGQQSPFVSLASGCVERDALLQRNVIHSAVDIALHFATDCWASPGALFYCWTPVGLNPAAEVSAVAEAVRDLNVYQGWSPYQLEGEITAKVGVPANQISRVEWWDGSQSKTGAFHTFVNPGFVDPGPVTNLRDSF